MRANEVSEESEIRKLDQANGPIFFWLQTEDGWYHTEGLIDGLIDGGGNGYQYIDGGDFVIEMPACFSC
jgi:hypothetical protein